MTDKSLIKVDSKAANTLIEKISDAVGGIFKPSQIKRIAKAESEANIIKAKTQAEVNLIEASSTIAITDLQKRAMHRFIEEEALKQQNIENIMVKAIPNLSENADANKIENDWIINFFDKSRIISDEQMQQLWASILAGEANEPQTYSKRTVNLLSNLDKRDIEAFQALCNFGWYFEDKFIPIIINHFDSIYTENSIYFTKLINLDSTGLIKFNFSKGFARKGLPEKYRITYLNQPLDLSTTKGVLQIGGVMLTKVGRELSRVCSVNKIDGFYDYIKKNLKTHVT